MIRGSRTSEGLRKYVCRVAFKGPEEICVSVAFRLALEHRLPHSLWGLVWRFLWLRSVAPGVIEQLWLTRYIDFSRCVLRGYSSGANLIHEVDLRAQATPSDLLHPVCVQGGISMHLGYLRSERRQSEKENPSESTLFPDTICARGNHFQKSFHHQPNGTWRSTSKRPQVSAHAGGHCWQRPH